MSVVIGWDGGGAHLKAARAEGGRIVASIQIASPLWLGVSRLDEAFRTGRSELGSADAPAATMTGELSMAFKSRSEGGADRTLLPGSAPHRHAVDDDRHHSRNGGRPGNSFTPASCGAWHSRART